MSKKIVVEPYNSNWISQFQDLKNMIWPAVIDVAKSIEHVGSTSVPGLAAKPVIDIDIVIADMSKLNGAIKALANLGYQHRGNLGIEDREAFRLIEPIHKHNLYVCPEGSIALRNHLCLRDSLRRDPSLRDEYAALKWRLSEEFPNSIDNYVDGKTDFILRVLEKSGFRPSEIEAIRLGNALTFPKGNVE